MAITSNELLGQEESSGKQRLCILFLANLDVKSPYYAGGDQAMWGYAKVLAKAGHCVYFLSKNSKNFPREELLDEITILRHGNACTGPIAGLMTYLRKKNQVDVVIEDTLAGFRLPYLSVLYARVPVISLWHQRNSYLYREQFGTALGKILGLLERAIGAIYDKRAARIITPSHDSARDLSTMICKRKIGIVPLYSVTFAEQTKISPDSISSKLARRTILFVGKIRRLKRIQDVLCACSIVKEKYRNLKVIIAGRLSEFDSGYLDELKLWSKNLGLEGSVTFLTNISEQAKNALYLESTVLVVPSPVEGFSYVILEANSLGTPVIGTDGVPSDVLIDNYNGLVYPTGDTGALANSILSMLTGEADYANLSRNALNWSKSFTSYQTEKSLVRELGLALNQNF